VTVTTREAAERETSIASQPGIIVDDRPYAAVAILASAVVLVPTLGFGFGFNHGFYEYIGWAILHGQWPYTDAWDTSTPGAMLIHLAVITAGGTSAYALRAADFLLEVVACALLFLLARRVAESPRAGVYASAAYAITYVAAGYYHTAERDAFIVPFLLLALWLLWRYLDDPTRRHRLLWSGLSAGLACLIRPTYALVVVAGAASLVAWSATRRRASPEARRRVLVDAALWSAVAASPLLAFIAVYVATGRGHAIIELATLLQTVYVHLERKTKTEIVLGLFTYTPRSVLVGAALSLFTLARRTHRRELVTVWALFVLCLLVRFWESKGYRYQYWPLIACLAIVAGDGWDWLVSSAVRVARLDGRRAAAVGLLGMAAVLLVQFGRTGVSRYAELSAALSPADDAAAFRHMIADSPAQADLARYLWMHTTPDDEIQLWGPEPIVQYATRRLSATRFFDQFQFVCPNHGQLTLFTDCGPTWNKPIQATFRREFVARLSARPPRYIAAHYADGSLAIEEGPSLAPDLPELRQLLDAQYVREATFGSWSAFRRVGP
jgi:hypothetical protein